MKRFIGILILLCALVIHVLPFSVVSASKWNFEEEMGKADTFLKKLMVIWITILSHVNTAV